MCQNGEITHLETVALSESQIADITLVRFFSCVDAKMSLEFVGVWAGVRAVRTLVRTLSGMRADVSAQLAQFHRCVAALGATVRLLICVPIAHVSHQFAGRCERCVTLLAHTHAHDPLCMKIGVVCSAGI